MTAQTLLDRLEAVRSRGAGKWSARCPAHQDSSPSLSIAAGEKGLLIHCFALCNNQDIVAAVGLTMADLFFDAPPDHRKRSHPRLAKLNRLALAWRFELAALDLRLRAERVVEAGGNVAINVLTDEELDRALAYVANIYADVRRAELFEGVADTLREREYNERANRERQPCAA